MSVRREDERQIKKLYCGEVENSCQPIVQDGTS